MSARISLALAVSVLSTELIAPPAARAQISQAEYAQRRSALVAQMQDGVLLARGAPEPVLDYEAFFQSSPFLYLTGYREPGAALVIAKGGGQTTSLLFVEPRDPAREVWSGVRLGAEGATKATGIPARAARELRPVLDSLIGTAKRLYVVGDIGSGESDGREVLTADEQFVRALAASRQGLEVVNANDIVQKLRGKKSDAELDLIRKAVEITVVAQQEAMRAIEPTMNEFEVQALIEYTFRRNGADRPSFTTIVGSGPNSTTLHYNADDRFMNAGEVVVMDIGASYRGYAADVTRTVPVSGTFSPDQRQVYQIVRDAQAAAERQAKVGAEARLMHDSSVVVIAGGLARLGLIEAPGATYDCDARASRQCSQVSLYYMHGLGHGIGLDVHDPEQFYYTGKIDAGSAFTIEPGIYVRENLLSIIPETERNRSLIEKVRPAVKRFAGIGVRIEDDYVVTPNGVEWISRAPREITEVEAMMRAPFAGPMPRDPVKIEWYRKQ